MAEYAANHDQMSDEDLLDQAKRCYKLIVATEGAQREREREDIMFLRPEHQWDAEAKKQREGRPMPSISLLKQPIQLVYNQFTNSRLGVNFHPVGENANKELAEMKQGLYRRIERDGGAAHARGWAFMRALVAGRGWYRVVTRYDEDAPANSVAAWDQEIAFQRILHQESVYMDPAAQEPDYSDAKWCLVITWMSKADFRKAFPNSRAAEAGAVEWDALQQEAPGWVNAAAQDDQERGVLVAEYWYREVFKEEITFKRHKRTREKVRVSCCYLTGFEVLEKMPWPGRYLPFVPVIGEELPTYDGVREWQGMVRLARDPQQMFNFGAAAFIEKMSSEPKSPWLVEESQIADYKEIWDTANTKNWTYLPYKATMIDGKPAAPPQRVQLDMTGTSMAQQALMIGKDFVQSTTAIYDPSLGKAENRQESGRKVRALQEQAAAGTSQFVQNLVDISLTHEARIVDDLEPHIYDRKGRVTAIVTGEDETEAVMLGVPFTRDPATQRPVKAKPDDPNAKTFTLAGSRYGISVDIGQGHKTRMEAGREFLTAIIAEVPQIMEIAGDLVFKFRDEPGSPEIAERLRKMIAGKYPGLLDEKGVQAPEAAAAELQGLKQQMQLMGAEMQAMGKALETEQVKAQARLTETQLKIQSDERIAAANNETKLAIEGLTVQLEAMLAMQRASHEQAAQHKEMAHDVAMAAGGANTTKTTRNVGQDSEREDGHEMNEGGSSERSEQDQPPQAGGEE